MLSGLCFHLHLGNPLILCECMRLMLDEKRMKKHVDLKLTGSTEGISMNDTGPNMLNSGA